MEAAREQLVAINDDAGLIKAAKLLSFRPDLAIVCDGESVLQASSPEEAQLVDCVEGIGFR